MPTEREILGAREVAVMSRDLDALTPPASPAGRSVAPTDEAIMQGLGDVGTARALLEQLTRDNRAMVAEWIDAALAAGSIPKAQIARLAHVSRDVVHNRARMLSER